jgi:Ca2+-binding EF-hand superfamily protein
MKKLWIPLALTLLVVAAAAHAHPRQGRGMQPRGDGWETFAERFDANSDGQVTAEEYDGRFNFKFVDFNGDGVVTEADFDARRIEHHTKMLTFGTLMHADEDRDGSVSQADYSAFLAQLDANGDGTLERSELGELRRHPRGERGGPEGEDEGAGAPDRPEINIAIADLEASFAKLDANGDGVVERDELPQRRHRGGEGHGPRRGPRGR